MGISPQASPESGPSVVLVDLLFSGEQTRYLQGGGGSKIFLVPFFTREEVFLIDLSIQNVFVCSPEDAGQTAEALSSAYFGLLQPACCGADEQVVSGSFRYE